MTLYVTWQGPQDKSGLRQMTVEWMDRSGISYQHTLRTTRKQLVEAAKKNGDNVEFNPE